jgi:hypothetical protein
LIEKLGRMMTDEKMEEIKKEETTCKFSSGSQVEMFIKKKRRIQGVWMDIEIFKTPKYLSSVIL